MSTVKAHSSQQQSMIQNLESSIKIAVDQRDELRSNLDEQKQLVSNLNDALSQERQRNTQLNTLLARESSKSDTLK